MKKTIFSLTLGALISTTLAITPAYAIDEDDCAIWLCLPAGFPSGCGGALSKFKHRIKKLKPPAPPFASCVVQPQNGSGGNVSTEPPYDIYPKTVIYANYGQGVTRKEYRYNAMTKCPYNGEYTEKRHYSSRGRSITETWLVGICTRTQEYGTSLNDYTYIYSETGKPLKTTQGKFTPKLLRRSSMSDK